MPSRATTDDHLFDMVEAYYSRKLARHGATPRGVDWSCVPSQELRFVQLLKLCDFSAPFTLNDLGCGYGALLTYLGWRHPEAVVDYLGVDLSPTMIARARRLWRNRARSAFVVGHASTRIADYSVASGIFNVALDIPEPRWESHVGRVLRHLRTTSRRGFAVNFVASAPTKGHAKAGLYRASSGAWTRHCEAVLGSRVELVDGYGLREFTLLVRP